MKPISSEELLTGCLNGFNATMPEMKPSNVIWKKKEGWLSEVAAINTQGSSLKNSLFITNVCMMSFIKIQFIKWNSATL